MANETWNADKKHRILHIMYFVDSESTKTISVRLRYIKIAIVGVGAFAALSMMSTAVAVLLALQIRHLENKSRELKSAAIAQSIVHDNLLKVAPIMVASGANAVLNPTVASVTASLAAGKAIAANGDESALADAEPTDEESTASANKKMEINESVQEGEPETAPKTEAEPAVAQAAPQVKSAAAQLAEKNSMALTARANQAAAELQKLKEGKATPTNTTKNTTTQLDTSVIFDEFKSSYDIMNKKATVEFNIRKQVQNNITIDGKFCAVIIGKTSQGKPVSLVFPPGTTPEELQNEECAHTYPVRLARFRPTALSFLTEPVTLESATLLFESGTVKTLFSAPLSPSQK